MVGNVKTKQNGIDQTRLKISWSKIFYRALLEIYYCYTVHKPITNHLQTVSFTVVCEDGKCSATFYIVIIFTGGDGASIPLNITQFPTLTYVVGYTHITQCRQ